MISLRRDPEDVFYVTLHALREHRLPRASVNINGCPLEMIIDTGSSINIISEPDFAKLQNKPKLHRTGIAYGASHPLRIAGKFRANIAAVDDRIVDAQFYVASGNTFTSSLLGCDTACKIGLVTLHPSVYNASTPSTR